MNFKRLLTVTLFAALTLSGCIKENMDDCPDKFNVEILFTYDDDPDAEFTDYIRQVDIALYDADGRYLFRDGAGLESLREFEGIKLTLDPGKYYVVAWGNVIDNSTFISTGTRSIGNHLLDIKESSTQTGDPVYYAPHKEKPGDGFSRSASSRATDIYEFEVKSEGISTKTLDFVRAHRTVNVWVKGFFTYGNAGGAHPAVKAEQLWTCSDFYFVTQPERRDFQQVAGEYTEGGVRYSKATFHSKLGVIEDNMDIHILRSADGQHRYTVNLKEFVIDNAITDTDEIDIMIEFFDLGVTVSVPDWIEKPVTPGN